MPEQPKPTEAPPLPVRLISTDFDGTLFAEFENPPIPRQLQELLGSLQARGVKWAINTGREMSSLMEAIGRAGLTVKPDYLVLVEREIHLHQETRYLGLEEWNGPCHRVHGELFAQIQTHLPGLVEWIKARFDATIYEDPYSPLCLIAANNDEMDAIHLHLEEFARTIPHLSVVRNDVYARFSHAAYNKGTALAELQRRLGVGPGETFAIGDHLNDLPMLSLRHARLLAAPANAITSVLETVRRQGGYISPRPHGHGVADAIKYYLAGIPGDQVDLL